MAFIGKDSKYKWQFENIGGTTRVRITSGEDIKHLYELDPKMWTVLSCPVKGLEISEKSMSFMDIDKDGKIRVHDIIEVSQWLTGALKNADLILEGKDCIALDQFNQEDAVGKKLYNASVQILKNLGKESNEISLTDTTDKAAIFAQTCYNGDGVITETATEDAELKALIAAAVASTGGVADRSGKQGINAELIEAFYKALAEYVAWQEAVVEAPFGADTDKAIDLYNALDAKVKDFFVRSKLAAFSPEGTSALDVQTSRIEAISAENLSGKADEIGSYPLARVTGKVEIDLTSAINPAWASQFAALISIVAPSKKVLTEADWSEIGAKFAAYSAWKAAKAGNSVEALGLDVCKAYLENNRKDELTALINQDLALTEESNNIDMVERFLYIFRDFYRLLKNFVTFHDFYNKDKDVAAIFQSGRLIIDQRECRFCMNVVDMAKHNATAATSGMFLLYCDCTTSLKPTKLQIVAAITVGDIGDLIVGKNAVYYDNEGVEWDAVITKIIENPISIAQSFWSPYRRMAKAVENLISKSAADKDAKMMENATAKINAAPSAVPTAPADPAAADSAAKQQPAPFDIGKFAGIFAAIGMAVGMIGTALAALAEGIFALAWYEVLLSFAGILLLISGPAMVMAWLKLRRRNIAPLLNANGWAINAASKISIPFGETLTDIAKYPKLKLKDPYAKTGLAPWKKAVITLFFLVALGGGLWLGNLLDWAGLRSPLPRFNRTEVVADSTAVDSLATLDTTVLTEAPAEPVAE